MTQQNGFHRRIYVGTHDGVCALNTTDGGLIWEQGKITPLANAAARLSASPVDPERVYLAAYEAGVFRTDDGGVTWRQLSSYPTGYAHSVLAHPGERTYSIFSPEKGREKSGVAEILEELCSYGLLGLECIYPYHERVGSVDYFLKMADKMGLIATGSRDFHGFYYNQKKSILGIANMDDTFYEKFQQAWNPLAGEAVG